MSAQAFQDKMVQEVLTGTLYNKKNLQILSATRSVLLFEIVPLLKPHLFFCVANYGVLFVSRRNLKLTLQAILSSPFSASLMTVVDTIAMELGGMDLIQSFHDRSEKKGLALCLGQGILRLMSPYAVLKYER